MSFAGLAFVSVAFSFPVAFAFEAFPFANRIGSLACCSSVVARSFAQPFRFCCLR